MKTTIQLNHEQQIIFNKLNNNHSHFFITGRAGTGKSTLLKYFRKHTNKNIAVVAPTGIAALQVQGQTIHSLLCIPPNFKRPEEIEIKYKVQQLVENLDSLIIDEVSMLDSKLINAVDYVLRKSTGIDDPFGGIQIILFGDPFQLPPVITSKEDERFLNDTFGGKYFFNAPAWKQKTLHAYELNKVLRQDDDHFIEILNAIRNGGVDDHHLKELNQRVVKPSEHGSIYLTATNLQAKTVNQYYLDKINASLHKYQASVTGNFSNKNCPADNPLYIKEGAQVMMTKNDPDGRWVNGSLGKAVEVTNSEIWVSIKGSVYKVDRETWENTKQSYDPIFGTITQEVAGVFSQYPMRLAWAITIHKSQGQTIESIIIHLGNRNAFATGQLYVALSRCTSLGGLYLTRKITKKDILVDEKVIEFMNQASKQRESK